MATKLLLIEDVESLGRSGDVVSVKPGYARNFLIPQGLAEVASAHVLRKQARLQEERQQKAIQDKSEAEAVAGKLNGLVVVTTVKVDHEGHMYGSVSQADIAHLVQEQHGIALDKKNVHLKHHIKEVGVHEIKLRLKEGVEAVITLNVEAEAHA